MLAISSIASWEKAMFKPSTLRSSIAWMSRLYFVSWRILLKSSWVNVCIFTCTGSLPWSSTARSDGFDFSKAPAPTNRMFLVSILSPREPWSYVLAYLSSLWQKCHQGGAAGHIARLRRLPWRYSACHRAKQDYSWINLTPYRLGEFVYFVNDHDALGFNLLLHEVIHINHVIQLSCECVDQLGSELLDLDPLDVVLLLLDAIVVIHEYSHLVQ